MLIDAFVVFFNFKGHLKPLRNYLWLEIVKRRKGVSFCGLPVLKQAKKSKRVKLGF